MWRIILHIKSPWALIGCSNELKRSVRALESQSPVSLIVEWNRAMQPGMVRAAANTSGSLRLRYECGTNYWGPEIYLGRNCH